MLNSLAKRIVLMPSLIALEDASRAIHVTALLARMGKDCCPESEVPGCKVVKRRPCSPTDPPVRPCSEQDCTPPRYPCCVSTSIASNPCAEPRKKAKFASMWKSYKDKGIERPETMWHYPEECCPKCEDTRFDVLYYTPSDKCREFQRTWWECCPRMVPKRVCCWCDAIPPQVLRRDLPICPRSSCLQEHERKRYKCLNERYKGCMRIRMPCCRTARIPPDCKAMRTPSDCEKVKCPFPSYSECLQEDPAVIPMRPPECECLKKASTCEQIRRAEHMEHNNISIWPCSSRGS